MTTSYQPHAEYYITHSSRPCPASVHYAFLNPAYQAGPSLRNFRGLQGRYYKSDVQATGTYLPTYTPTGTSPRSVSGGCASWKRLSATLRSGPTLGSKSGVPSAHPRAWYRCRSMEGCESYIPTRHHAPGAFVARLLSTQARMVSQIVNNLHDLWKTPHRVYRHVKRSSHPSPGQVALDAPPPPNPELEHTSTT